MTLAVISLAAGVVGASIVGRAPRLAVERAADTLVVDLKRARLAADTSGEPVFIEATAEGYRIEALRLERRHVSGLNVFWNDKSIADLAISAGLEQPAISIRVRKRGAEAIITVAAVSGRIARED